MLLSLHNHHLKPDIDDSFFFFLIFLATKIIGIVPVSGMWLPFVSPYYCPTLYSVTLLYPVDLGGIHYANL